MWRSTENNFSSSGNMSSSCASSWDGRVGDKGDCISVPTILTMGAECNPRWANQGASHLLPSQLSIPTWRDSGRSKHNHMTHPRKIRVLSQNLSSFSWRKECFPLWLPVRMWSRGCLWPCTLLLGELAARKMRPVLRKKQTHQEIPLGPGGPGLDYCGPSAVSVIEFPPWVPLLLQYSSPNPLFCLNSFEVSFYHLCPRQPSKWL